MSTKESFFDKRRNATTSAFDKVSGGGEDPLQFSLAKFKKGTTPDGFQDQHSVFFRILSLTEDDRREYTMREVTSAWKRKEEANYNLYPYAKVIDPGAPANQEIIDDAGKPICEGRMSYFMRVPVFVNKKTDENGKVLQAYNKVMYMDLPTHVLKQLKDLSENAKDGHAFKGIPDYWLELRYDKDDTQRPFTLTAVDSRSNELTKEYGVPIEEIILGADNDQKAFDEFVEDVEAIIEHIHEVTDKQESDLDAIKRTFTHYRDNAFKAGSISAAVDDEEDDADADPELPAEEEKPVRPSRTKPVVQDDADAVAEDVTEAKPARTNRFAGRGNRS